MLNYVWVFLGGGLGSICRYGIAHLLQKYQLTFPLATLLANALACVVLGYFLGRSLHDGVSGTERMLIMTGFCGGFSTFSTFSGETLYLFQTGDYGYAFLNILASLLVCLGCIYGGMKLGS
jgi:CrcB protein